MKKVMKNKKVIAIMAVGLLAILLTATGVIASPPEGAADPPVASKINYQGQLTDDAGSPLSGTYDMEFQLWDSASGGSQVGSTITKNSVEVTNGLFSVKLDVDQSDFDGQGLWLQMRVRPQSGSWDPWMDPRQEVLPVPYALSLKPGAKIEGNVGYPAALVAENTATSGIADGIWGVTASNGGGGVYGWATATSGETYGVYGKSDSTDGYGGYFESPSGIAVYGTTGSDDTEIPTIKGENTGHGDGVLGIGSWYGSIGVYGQSGFGTGVRGEGEVGVSGESNLGPGVQGEGMIGVHGMSDVGTGVYGYSTSGTAISAGGTGVIESTADSYIFISGNEFIKNVNTDSTRWDCQGNGSVRIWRGSTTGSKFLYIPVTLPGVLYGQNVTVEQLTIYYKCQDGTKDYIGNTCLWKQTSATGFVELVTDYTHWTSNAATSYTLTPTSNNELSSDQGILSLSIRLDFVDDTNYIQLGGARLRLGHSD